MPANSPAPETGLDRIVELDAENPAGCLEIAELEQNSAGSLERAELNLDSYHTDRDHPLRS